VKPSTCPAGYYAVARSGACRACAAGSYQPKAAQATCLSCPAGSFCPGAAQSKPTSCPAGTYRTLLSGAARSDCTACPINTYSAAGAKACTKCGNNQWTGRLTGQAACWPTTQKVPAAKTR